MLSNESDGKYTTDRIGFYYHFLDMKTGKRFWNCELSSIDSGLLFCGMIFARNYFTQNNEIESQIRNLVGKLLDRADWKQWIMSEATKYPKTISYQIAKASNVTLRIYDALGKEVEALVDEYKQPGVYSLQFMPKASLRDNSQLPSGVYYCRLHAGEYISTKKMILLK